MIKHLLQMMPPHKTYVDVFGGAGSLLFAKDPSPIEVYNDIDDGLANFYRVIQSPALFRRFRRLAELIPYSRSAYYRHRQEWNKQSDPATRAAMWFAVARMSFSGIFGRSWSFSVSQSSRGMSGSVSKYLSSVDGLPDIHARIRTVQIECNDFAEIIDSYDTPDTLFYLDPPYVHDTRTEKNGYTHEMTDDDHRRLVDLLPKIKGQAIVSAYNHPIYAPLRKARWKVRRHEICTRSALAKCRNESRRTETIFCSPGCANPSSRKPSSPRKRGSRSK